MSSTPTSTDGTVSSGPIPASTEELKIAIRKQIEYYFSRENLIHDGYLRGLMNSQGAVPIARIVRFKRMTQICDDIDLLSSLIPEAIAGSSVCATTEDGGIKPILKSQRNIIVLRDIPSSTLKQTIQEAFEAGGVTTIQTLRADIGDTWFLTMESEAAAKDAFKAIQAKKITFQGEAIKARLKADTGTRMLASPANSPPAGVPGHFIMQQTPMAFMPVPHMINGQMYPPQPRVYSPRGSNMQSGRAAQQPSNRPDQRQQKQHNGRTDKTNGRRRNNEPDTSSREGARKKKGASNSKGQRDDSEKASKGKRGELPDFTETNFPPLAGEAVVETLKSTDTPTGTFEKEVPSPRKESASQDKEVAQSSTVETSSPPPTNPTKPPTDQEPSSGSFAGYAAALMKPSAPAPSKAAQDDEPKREEPISDRKPISDVSETVAAQAPVQNVVKDVPIEPPVAAKPPTPPVAEETTKIEKQGSEATQTPSPRSPDSSAPTADPETKVAWGGKRSFLDVVKNQDAHGIILEA